MNRLSGMKPLLLLVLVMLILAGCDQIVPVDQDVIYQYSTLDALLTGVYDGDVTYGELKQAGDFGVGTFHALDGEMITVDNKVYQVTADGAAREVTDDALSPFAVLTFFAADQTAELAEAVDCTQLGETIDTLLPTTNIPFAIKVEGTFEALKTRSVPRQEKPYPPLADVVATQPTFDFEQVDGVMVGFRLPDYVGSANVPGYHWHFLTADRTAGGHVLACTIGSVDIGIDHTGEWTVQLPDGGDFYEVE